jgi:hypothetical protein
MKKPKKHIDPEQFVPFKRYLENRDSLTKHITATELAYALAVCTLSDNRLEAVDPITLKGTADPIILKEADSFSKADFGVRSVKRLYGWVNFDEYIELEKISIEEFRNRLDAGLLGRVEKHPKTKEFIIIWPTAKYASPEADALTLGMSQWSVETRGPSKIVGIQFDSEDESSLDQARKALVYLGRELGEAHSVYTEAQELFYRGSFLNLWTSFEIFVKDSFADLVRRFPLSLATLPDWKKLSLAYSDLVIQTDGLQDISSLREILISAEIAKAETGGRNISGLINLLKAMFNWSDDLYQRPYREGGVTLKTNYNDLNEIREVRNALAHQNSQQTGILEKSSRLKFVEGRPAVDKDYLHWAGVVMSSIAHGISEDVIGGRVSVKGMLASDEGKPER